MQGFPPENAILFCVLTVKMTRVEPGWNLGGTSEQVPPLAIPLRKGVSAKKGGMWNLSCFSSFFEITRQKMAVPSC